MRKETKDRRVRYTKTVLRESLLELMKTQPINKITVTDICGKADINRGTFYAHYTDPYDLLKQIEEELLHTIEGSLQAKTTQELLLEIFQAILQHGELCKILFSEYGDKEFLKRVMYIAYDKSVLEWTAASRHIPADQLQLVYAFIANGCIGTIQSWVQKGFQETPQEIACLIDIVSSHGLQAFLSTL